MSGNTVDHPQHYENGPYECILLAEQYSFNVGNMIKYVWRHKAKGHPKEDLEKALWYAQRAKANGESFAAHPWHANSGPAYIRPPYDWATLMQLKADTTTGVEHDFWDSMTEAHDENAIDALCELLKETE
ncbi:DUF3310 domain-containing protein [Bifidobacterium longum]|uniref:DUF3310 domain-containing protein n=1 Tax=Bifidobacterium longum TaxID=216816 RepID=UPI00398CB04F